MICLVALKQQSCRSLAKIHLTKLLSKRKLKEESLITKKSIPQSIKIKNKFYIKYIQQDQFWYEAYKYYRNKIDILIKRTKGIT